MARIAAPTEGHCQYCNRLLQLKKDGTVRHHLAPKTSSYRPPVCFGEHRLPKESMPLSADLVGVVVRQVFTLIPGRCTPEAQTAIVQALVRELGPRLRAVEGQHAALVDLANLAAALVWEEIEPDSPEAVYAHEILAEEITALRALNPRLNPKERS